MTGDKSKESADGLLGDLESIRTALDDAPIDNSSQGKPREPAGGDDNADAQVPLLDDVVPGGEDSGFSVEETPYSEQSTDPADGGIDDELFDALLGDSWKETAAELLQETRATIEQHHSHWSQHDIDNLTETLHARLNDTLRIWLRSMVKQHIDDLRVSLLEATREELAIAVAKILTDNNEENEEHKDG